MRQLYFTVLSLATFRRLLHPVRRPQPHLRALPRVRQRQSWNDLVKGHTADAEVAWYCGLTEVRPSVETFDMLRGNLGSTPQGSESAVSFLATGPRTGQAQHAWFLVPRVAVTSAGRELGRRYDGRSGRSARLTRWRDDRNTCKMREAAASKHLQRATQ